MEVKTGMTGIAETVVADSNTAVSAGSGSLPVFATPCMVALMEKASCNAVAEALDEGTTSVGTTVNISHLSATPVGIKVKAESVVTEVDGRRICFNVTVSDSSGIIGKGTHERFVVDSQRFMSKTAKKLDNNN